MQVARLLEPRTRALASTSSSGRRCAPFELERALSKDEILASISRSRPYGGNLEGIRAASLAYFGKEPRRLTLGEAALLVALPQSPELRRPDRFARSRQCTRETGCSTAWRVTAMFDATEIERAKIEPCRMCARICR